jgi:hypothetical protein
VIDWEAHEGEYVDPVLHPYRGKLWHFGSRKNSVQKVSVCEGPISTPSTSRRPSLPPTAMITGTETIRPHLDGPAVFKSSFQVVIATREGCLPLLTLSGMVSGEARQIQVFEQHRRRLSASVGLGCRRRLLPPI